MKATIGTLVFLLCLVVAASCLGCAGAGQETRTALEEQRDVYYDANSFSMSDRTTHAGETFFVENVNGSDPNVTVSMSDDGGLKSVGGAATVVYRKHDPDAAAKAFSKAFVEREQTNREAINAIKEAYNKTLSMAESLYTLRASSRVASTTNTPTSTTTTSGDCSDGDCALQALGQTIITRLNAMSNDDKQALLDIAGLGALGPLLGVAEAVGPDAPED